MTSTEAAPQDAKRVLGFWSLLTLGINGIVGGGIFLVPGQLAQAVPGAASGTSVATRHARRSGSTKSGRVAASVALVIGGLSAPSTVTAIDTPAGTFTPLPGASRCS